MYVCKSKKLKHPLRPGRHVLRPEGVYTTAVGGPARAREPERVPLDGRRDFPFGFARESLETKPADGRGHDATRDPGETVRELHRTAKRFIVNSVSYFLVSIDRPTYAQYFGRQWTVVCNTSRAHSTPHKSHYSLLIGIARAQVLGQEHVVVLDAIA